MSMICPRRPHLFIFSSLRLFTLHKNINYIAKISTCNMATSSATTNTNSNNKVKTGILMLNMGGPSSLEEVEPFLTRLFLDTDIMQLPFQSSLGPWIARRRSGKIAEKYAEIGGKSPILDWTRKQGEKLVQLLNSKRPESAPHKFYVGFRYAKPLLDEALGQMTSDGVENAIAFSQYPHYSCSTTGSSLNQLAKMIQESPDKSPVRNIKWSLIDRWPLNEGLIDSISDLIQLEMNKLPPASKAVILFSAHSLPMVAVNRGDTYPAEVGSTVISVMERLKNKYPYRLVWQSKVGPLSWLEPRTDEAIREYAKRGIKNFVLVPIAFVNEHIETLHEMDIEFAKDLKKELNIDNILRVPAPNDNEKFIQGLYKLVDEHIASGKIASPQMTITCPKCVNPACSNMRKWIDGLF